MESGDSQKLYDENLDLEEEVIENNENQDDLIDDEELFDNENLDKNDQINEKIDEIKNENIDDKDNESYLKDTESNKISENNDISQSLDINSGTNLDDNKKNIENNKNNVTSSLESNSYRDENNYTKVANIDDGEPILKQINNIKRENMDSMNNFNNLKGSRRSLYNNGLGSNPQIAKSNHELYKNIVQKRYQLGNNKSEKKVRAPITEEIINQETEELKNDVSNSKESMHYHLQDPLTSQNFGKKEKIKYIESNMVDNAPVSISSLSEDDIKKKSDKWLNPIYLNNDKYKKNFEVDMNNLSVQILAQEFLTNENVDVETRAYLLESVFPVLCVSLEKLLIEIDRRKIIERDEKPTEFVVERTHNAIPRDVPFDSINWLGNNN